MIIGINGDIGSGKTVLGVYLAYKLKKKNYKIMSNVKIKFPDGSESEAINVKNLEHLDNCVIVLDEAHTILDSRRSASKTNLTTSYFILQTRKRGIVLIYTAQLGTSVDKRLRNVQDYNIVAIKNKKYFKYLISNQTQERSIIIDKEKFKPIFKMYDTNQIIPPII